MRRARRGALSRNFECRYVHKDGHAVPIAWTGIWSEPDGQYFFIGRDMTERIVLESQLRQAQKMEAIGQMTGGVAHDFNNLLTVIIGMSELLSDSVGQDPELAPIVQAIDEAASRGAQLTQRMLAFARKQPLQARNVDLNEVVARTAAILQRTLGEDIAVKLALGDGLWPALVDPSQIEDVILNLAVNARDAMPNGGQLVIETANAHLDEQYAAQNLDVSPGDYVLVNVTDFRHRHAARGGRAGVRAVLHHQGGRPRHRARPEHGVRLREAVARTCEDLQRGRPRHLDQALSAARRACGGGSRGGGRARGRGIRGGSETILVVEDSATVRGVAVGLLRGLGYTVLEAEDGHAALAILRQPVAIDLLFTDLIMPNGIDGQDLLRRRASCARACKAMFTSGYSEQFLQDRNSADAGVPLLNKPYRKHALAEAVRDVLDGVVPALDPRARARDALDSGSG